MTNTPILRNLDNFPPCVFYSNPSPHPAPITIRHKRVCALPVHIN